MESPQVANIEKCFLQKGLSTNSVCIFWVMKYLSFHLIFAFELQILAVSPVINPFLSLYILQNSGDNFIQETSKSSYFLILSESHNIY